MSFPQHLYPIWRLRDEADREWALRAFHALGFCYYSQVIDISLEFVRKNVPLIAHPYMLACHSPFGPYTNMFSASLATFALNQDPNVGPLGQFTLMNSSQQALGYMKRYHPVVPIPPVQ